MDTMNIHFDLLFIDSSYQEIDCISLDSFSINLKKNVCINSQDQDLIPNQ
jgi:hypothetical protein